jgi:hypothetical protein
MIGDVNATESGRTELTYEIVVRGALGQATLTDIGARAIAVGRGKTLIVLEIIDQSHLQGILGWLQDHNVAIERVNPI